MDVLKSLHVHTFELYCCCISDIQIDGDIPFHGIMCTCVRNTKGQSQKMVFYTILVSYAVYNTSDL